MPSTPPPENGSPPALDDLLVAFADRDRRRLLADLHDGGGLTVTEFVVAYADGRDRERFRLSLHHHHLPRLEHENLVSVDDERIHRGSDFTYAATLFDVLRANTDEIPGELV